MVRKGLILMFLLCLGSSGCATGQSQSGKPSRDMPEPTTYTWTQLTEHAPFPTGYNYPVYVAKGRMWAFHMKSIWSSADGKDWTLASLPSARRDIYQSDYVQLNDAVYALGNNEGNYERLRFRPTIRRTTDFQTWETLSERSNVPERIFRGVVVFDGKIWLLGGYDGKQYFNDVWNSADGVNWTRITDKAEWSPRTIATTVVFHDRIFIIGGGVIDGMPENNPNAAREIWSSADGKSWAKVTEELPKFWGGDPVVFDNKLWLVGANRDGVFARSSLVSPDGVNWAEESAPWSPRGGAAAWVFDGKLFMTGGKYSVTENGQIRFIYSNDVWVMTKTKGEAK